jgi:hypothetical protein
MRIQIKELLEKYERYLAMRIQIKELLEKYERYRDESHDLLDKFADMEDKKNKILGFIGVYTTIIDDLQKLLDESKEWQDDYDKYKKITLETEATQHLGK